MLFLGDLDVVLAFVGFHEVKTWHGSLHYVNGNSRLHSPLQQAPAFE
jgi:hypothetical protein